MQVDTNTINIAKAIAGLRKTARVKVSEKVKREVAARRKSELLLDEIRMNRGFEL